MDLQHLYTTVRKHLLTQNAKALHENGECVYKTKEGLRCAVGCLISDEDYLPSMEGTSIDNPSIIQAAGFTPPSGPESCDFPEFKLARDLQVVHDKSEPSEWREKLDQVADKFNLIVED